MVRIILITHGSLGSSLIETASAICCFSNEEVLSFTVSGKVNLEEVESKIKNSFSQNGTLILVDGFGGTSSNIALKCSVNQNNVFVVCGVNLNMLLAALSNQAKMNLTELTEKVISDGKKAILEATELIKK